jgi:hypothetical protein
MATGGNAPRSNGGAVLLGEEENPSPNCAGMMKKYLSGSSGARRRQKTA